MAKKRKRSDESVAKYTHTNGKAKDTVVDVSIAPTSRGHCGWCDTLIEKGDVRVSRQLYHAPGSYSRNNGASTGYNNGGYQLESLHVLCAFEVGFTKQKVKCSSCFENMDSGINFYTRLGSAQQRFKISSSGKKYLCLKCVNGFVNTHSCLLKGTISSETFFKRTPPWLKPKKGLFGKPALGRPLPKQNVKKNKFLEIFDTVNDEKSKLLAIENYEKIRKNIEKVMKEDVLLLKKKDKIK